MTIAIIAILLGIAIPSYNSYVQAGLAREGEAGLEAVLAAEKTYRQRHATFAAFSDLGTARSTLGINLADTPDFDVAASGASATQVTVTATGKNGATGIVMTWTYDTTTGLTTKS